MASAVDVVKGAFGAYQQGVAAGGDYSEMAEFFAPGFTHTVEPEGAGALSGTYPDFEAFTGFLAKTAADPNFKVIGFVPREGLVGEGADVVVAMTVQMTGGTSEDTLYFDVSDDKITRSLHVIGEPELAAQAYPV